MLDQRSEMLEDPTDAAELQVCRTMGPGAADHRALLSGRALIAHTSRQDSYSPRWAEYRQYTKRA